MVQNYPRDAAYTPRTIIKLDLCNNQNNKHNSRITIYINYTIVINSEEVRFSIKRQYAEVGCKNLIISSYENYLCRFYRKGKQFL
jgi:peroxiredoxin